MRGGFRETIGGLNQTMVLCQQAMRVSPETVVSEGLTEPRLLVVPIFLWYLMAGTHSQSELVW
jgi:hypothetical protein